MAIDWEDPDPFGDDISNNSEYIDQEFPEADLVSRDDDQPIRQSPEENETEKPDEEKPAAQFHSEPVGRGEYLVKEGDCMAQIAFDNGFLLKTLWMDSQNAELRRVRKNPYLLFSGDRVHIPTRRKGEESCATAARHRFRRKGVPEIMNLKLINPQDQPLQKVDCCITIDGFHSRKTTDQNGNLKIPIPPNSRQVRVILEATGEQIPIGLGDLDPIDTLQGVRDRLRNIGFELNETSEGITPQDCKVIRAFQHKYLLKESAEIDEATRNKLLEVYGS